MLTLCQACCVLAGDKPFESLANLLRDESRSLSQLCKRASEDPFRRRPVGMLTRAQAIVGDMEGAIQTASIVQGSGPRDRRARFEALGDVAKIVARDSKLKQALAIVEGAPIEVKIRVVLAFASAVAKSNATRARGAVNAVHIAARKLKRRAKIRMLNQIAVVESGIGDSDRSLKTCMRALEAARSIKSPRERAWASAGIAQAMIDAGHKAAALKLADETLSVIDKVSGMQADEIKTDTKTDVAMILIQCGQFNRSMTMLEKLPHADRKFYGKKADILVSLATSAGESDRYSLRYAKFIDGVTTTQTHDRITTLVVKRMIDDGKLREAIDAVENFETNEARGESMLRIAAAMIRKGRWEKAQEIVNGVEGYVTANEQYALGWFQLKNPETWIRYWSDGDRELMRTRVVAAAIPLWYELQADGDLGESPLEQVKSEAWRLQSRDAIELLVRADGRYGDPDVVMRWLKPILKHGEPGDRLRVRLLAALAYQAAARLKDPPRPRPRRKKPAATTAPAPPGDGSIANWIIPPEPKIDNSPATALSRKLVAQFDKLTANIVSYRLEVARKCARFPEGDLFPYTLPAIAYANAALSDPLRRTDALKRMSGLIDSAVASTVARVKPPGGKLELLTSYKKHATYLGQLNMAIGYYRLIGGDDRYDAINKSISNVLHRALVESKGRPLASFPTYSWTFDTAPVLLSLKLYDHNTGSQRSDAASRSHLDWMSKNAFHKPSGLPYSRINSSGRGLALPRGCDLSWRISMIAQFDAKLAAGMYHRYAKAFWLERIVAAGFAEWPGGKSSRQDGDSGPIVMGIGMTASGMGLAASASAGDTTRRDRLAAQTIAFKALMRKLVAAQPKMRSKLTLGGLIDPAGDYITGFLYGDASLFYAVSWQKLPFKQSEPTTRPATQPAPAQTP
jgi:hypothetical protein